ADAPADDILAWLELCRAENGLIGAGALTAVEQPQRIETRRVFLVTLEALFQRRNDCRILARRDQRIFEEFCRDCFARIAHIGAERPRQFGDRSVHAARIRDPGRYLIAPRDRLADHLAESLVRRGRDRDAERAAERALRLGGGL